MIETTVFFALVLARVVAFVAALPLFGGGSVPRLVKVGLVLSLTVLWFAVFLPTRPSPAWFELHLATPWLGLGIALIREALLGLVLGYAFGLFLVPARIAGEYLTQEMGLSFGNLVSSAGTAPSGPLTQIFEALGAILFLGLDGHHVLLAVFHSTFARYPIGQALPEVPMPNLISGAALAEQWGLLVAAPVALVLFLTTMVLTLMMRVAPQLNLYTFGFPVRLAAGMGAMLVLLPNMLESLVSIYGRLSQLLGWLV